MFSRNEMKPKRFTAVLFLFVSLIVTTKIYAEGRTQTEELYRSVLAATEGQTWILEAWRGRLGQSSGCIQGVDWVFYSDGRLIKRNCVKGQVNEKKYQWSLSSKCPGPVKLVIDDYVHWIEILKDNINEPGLPPTEVLIAKIQELRVSQEKPVQLFELRRTND